MTQNFLNNVLQKCRANLSYQVYLHVKKLVFVSAFPNICKCNSALNSRDIKRAKICRDITIQREYLYCCPLSGNLFSFSSLQFRIFAGCKMLSASTQNNFKKLLLLTIWDAPLALLSSMARAAIIIRIIKIFLSLCWPFAYNNKFQ